MSRRPHEIRIDSLVVPGRSAADARELGAALARELARTRVGSTRVVPHAALELDGGAIDPGRAGERLGHDLKGLIEG